MDIVTKEIVDVVLEIVCGSVVLGMLSFSLYSSYIIPILGQLF